MDDLIGVTMLRVHLGAFLLWEGDHYRLPCCSGDDLDRVAEQGHAAGCDARVVLVADLKPQGFEESARQCVWHVGKVDCGDWEVVEQSRVGCEPYFVFDLGELLLQRFPLRLQLSASFVDIANESLVHVVGYFETADQPLALGFDLGDGAP